MRDKNPFKPHFHSKVSNFTIFWKEYAYRAGMSGFRGNKRIRMIKVKEKVVGFEVECDTCRNVLVFNQEDETYHDGDRDSCCKDIVCPVCGSNILVRDDFGDLVDEVKIIRVRVI